MRPCTLTPSVNKDLLAIEPVVIAMASLASMAMQHPPVQLPPVTTNQQTLGGAIQYQFVDGRLELRNAGGELQALFRTA